MFNRSKKDIRLKFSFQDLGLDQDQIKNYLIRLGYIEHVQGDRYRLLKKWDLNQIKETLIQLNNHELKIETSLVEKGE